MKFRRGIASLFLICIGVSTVWADSLELRNGSLIKGKFISGTANEISFQVGSAVQNYNLADVRSLKFDSDASASDFSTRPNNPPASDPGGAAVGFGVSTFTYVAIPAGTRISVRTIDAIDSTKNHVGDRFEATLEEPLTVDGNVVVPKGADVYGRLEKVKETGTFTGRSRLQLELTGIVVNGQTVPLVTGEYELSGKSRGESTAKRTFGGAAIGSIIGAIASGGKGAAIGAGAGGGLGAGSEIITKGDQVKIPSETLLDFTLQQSVSIPQRPN